MEDIFDSTLNLEETHLKEGFDDGYKDGLIAGKEEGKQVGLKVGFEVGEELGFYRGCVDVWNSVIRVDPTRFSSRVQKGIKQMEELIQKYPVMEPENESVQEIMDGLRLKFRAVCASMGAKLEYNGYPKSSSEANQIGF
ncbi:Essential protein Yae1, N-terminal [Trema orientale]|uniref:Essential protein Yae1, N-terminal n=1 Tax=Trema orientale TaxID=63057 RepID=A0A2P5E8S5_TREOI|nr:Essential protein Yae1, N-terminal [Trema orientale]